MESSDKQEHVTYVLRKGNVFVFPLKFNFKNELQQARISSA